MKKVHKLISPVSFPTSGNILSGKSVTSYQAHFKARLTKIHGKVHRVSTQSSRMRSLLLLSRIYLQRWDRTADSCFVYG